MSAAVPTAIPFAPAVDRDRKVTLMNPNETPEPDPILLVSQVGALAVCRGCGALYPTVGPLANKHTERCIARLSPLTD